MDNEIRDRPTKAAKSPLVVERTTPVTSEDIAERAYLHHVRRKCVHGFDVEDWLEAEKELIKESCDLS